jgi:2-dehydro-3-deoxygluconokinase
MVELSPQGSGLYRRNFAGDTYNTAVYLARHRPSDQIDYVTAVGCDKISVEMLEEMARQGLTTSEIVRHPNKTVGLYLIQTTAEGERSFSYWRDDSAAKMLFDIKSPEELLGPLQADLIYFSGISLAILLPDARQKLLDFIASTPRPVAFDPNYRPDDDRALWSLTTMDEATDRWRLISDAELVIKNGPGPVRLSHWTSDREGGKSGLQDLQPPLIEKPLDTTGAGDAFNAVYLSARLDGQPPRAAAVAAVQFCCQVVQARGAIVEI